MKEEKMKRKIKIAITIVITVIIFAVLFAKIDFSSVAKEISKANLGLIVFVVLLEFMVVLIKTIRWQKIMEAIGYKIQFRECWDLTMASFAFISITPSQLNDLAKGVFLKEKVPISKTAGTVLTERFFDVFLLALLVGIGFLFFPRREITTTFIVVILGLLTLLLLPHIKHTSFFKKCFSNSIREKTVNFLLSMKIVTKKKNFFLKIFGYSLIMWAISTAQVWVLFHSMGIDVPVLFVMGNMPIAIFISLIPVTLGGMGTRDAAIIYLFSGYASSAQLLGIGILYSFVRYWLFTIIGLFYLRKVS